jgi:hypothetical protein
MRPPFSLCLAAAAVAVISGPVYGQSTLSEWKYFGSVRAAQVNEIKVPATYLFFDVKGARQLPNHHVIVWTKGLDQAEVDGFADKNDVALMDAMAKRVQENYVPPLAQLTGAQPDKNRKSYLSFVYWETVADTKDLQPVTRVLYEIDCVEQTTRSNAMQIWALDSKDNPISTEDPGAWEHAAPESNSGYLVAMLCKRR